MDDNKYLQLSISAFITAIVIGLGWIITHRGLSEDWIPWINGVLIGISTLAGLFFLYKYTISDSKAEGFEWVDNLVERIYQVMPQIALVPPLLVSAMIVTQIISNIEADISPSFKTQISSDFEEIEKNLSTIMTKFSANEQILNSIATQTNNTSSTIMTKLSTNEQKLDNIATEIHNITCCPPMEVSSTEYPTITPTPETIGCVITYGMNVRKIAGVTDTPSNHAKIWLGNDACVTILETSSPEWARVRIEGWIRLKKGETDYVVTVTPTATLSPTATQP